MTGPGVAIVAIPDRGDPVWKVSSEQVPHMTLLFLGDSVSPEAAVKIEEFLAHLTDTSLSRFGAMVDYRDTLGPKDADVLFFRKDDLKSVVQARADMLQNPQILAAYRSTEQYPEWTPHLTLGYPETPAKETDPDMEIHWVSFAKIALWTGDFEGPEFRLDDRWEQTMAMGTDYASHILSHHGVKGMKWGVRHDPGHAGERAKTKTIAKADKKFEKEIASANKGVILNPEFHNAAVRRINARVDELNDSPKYRDVDMSTYHGKLKADYERDAQKLIVRSFEDATRQVYGSNASGTKKAVYDGKTDQIRIIEKTAPVVHSAVTGKVPDVVIQLHRKTTGHISSVTMEAEGSPAEEAAESPSQEAAEVGHSSLEHHGVKGMKWGVHRDRATGAIKDARSKLNQEIADRKSETVVVRTKAGEGVRTVGGNKQMAHPDAIKARTAEQVAKRSTLDALSNQELQSLVTRMNLEQQYRNLSVHEDRRSAGEKYAMKLLDEHGDKALSKLGPAAPLVKDKLGDAINGNKAFDTGSATNKKK